MKKLWLLLLPLILWGQTRWVEYEAALSQAKKEHKIVILMAESHDCHYCTYMKETVLIDPMVADRLEKEFVMVKLDHTDRRLPSKVSMTPTFFFLHPDTRAVLKKVPGAWGQKDFTDFLNSAQKEMK